jgi:2-phospho-L-lactate guanylyltransferase
VDAASAPRLGVIAIVPVGALEGAKSRLGGTLDAEERRDLVLSLLDQALRATASSPSIRETLVVTPDDAVRKLAAAAGARPIRQRSQGLNAGLREARDEAMAAGAEAIIVLPIDLPLLTASALADVVGAIAGPAQEPIVVLVSDRRRRGTNALLLRPPDVIDFGFGGDSRACHEGAARAAGARYLELDGPLTVDLDTPEDLLLAQELAPEAVDAV